MEPHMHTIHRHKVGVNCFQFLTYNMSCYQSYPTIKVSCPHTLEWSAKHEDRKALASVDRPGGKGGWLPVADPALLTGLLSCQQV